MYTLRFQIFCISFIATTALIWYGVEFWIALLCLLISGGIYLYLSRYSHAKLVSICLAIILGMIHVPLRDSIYATAHPDQLTQIHGTVSQIKHRTITIKTDNYGTIILYGKNPALQNGFNISAQGKLTKPTKYEFYYKSQNIQYILKSYRIISISQPKSLYQKFSNSIYHLQKKLLHVHKTSLSEVDNALVNKLILGRNSLYSLPQDIKLSAQHLGVSHLFAASGLHLNIIAASVFFFVGIFTRRPHWKSLCTLACCSIYCTLGGWSPSLIRAWTGISFMLMGQHFQQKPRTINILLLSLICQIILDPNSIGDVGLQYSYLATLSLVFFSRYLAEKINLVPMSWSYWFIIPISAQILLFPLQILYQGNLIPYFVLANAVLVPIAASILNISLIVSCISIIGSFGTTIGSIINYINKIFLWFFQLLVQWFGNLSMADLAMDQISLSLCLWIYFCIVCVFSWKALKLRIQKKRLIYIFITITICIYSFPKQWFNNILYIDFHKHKTAYSTLIQHKGWQSFNIVVCSKHKSPRKLPHSNLAQDILSEYQINKVDWLLGNCYLDSPKIINRISLPKNNTSIEFPNNIQAYMNQNSLLFVYKQFGFLVLLRPVQHDSPHQYTLTYQAFEPAITTPIHHSNYCITKASKMSNCSEIHSPNNITLQTNGLYIKANKD